MKKTELDITDNIVEYSKNLALNEIVFDMITEFNNNKDAYINERYSKLYDLAHKVFKNIVPGNLRIEYEIYIYDQFISVIEDLFKYCDDCEQYIKVEEGDTNECSKI